MDLTKIPSLHPRVTKVDLLCDQAVRGAGISQSTLKAKMLNLVGRGKIARETQATLNAIKAAVEGASVRW